MVWQKAPLAAAIVSLTSLTCCLVERKTRTIRRISTPSSRFALQQTFRQSHQSVAIVFDNALRACVLSGDDLSHLPSILIAVPLRKSRCCASRVRGICSSFLPKVHGPISDMPYSQTIARAVRGALNIRSKRRWLMRSRKYLGNSPTHQYCNLAQQILFGVVVTITFRQLLGTPRAIPRG